MAYACMPKCESDWDIASGLLSSLDNPCEEGAYHACTDRQRPRLVGEVEQIF